MRATLLLLLVALAAAAHHAAGQADLQRPRVGEPAKSVRPVCAHPYQEYLD